MSPAMYAAILGMIILAAAITAGITAATIALHKILNK